MRYLIGSSYFEGGKNGVEFRYRFSPIWSDQIKKASPAPSRIVVICDGNSQRPFSPGIQTVNLEGNLGHVGQHINGTKKYEFTGWSASMLMTALMAYADESDFIYVEEDCLAFGPWVERLYDDMGEAVMAFGKKHTSPPWMSCSQSLFIVRHSFIPTFVSTYLRLGRDGDTRSLGELKFCTMEEQFGPTLIRRMSFGVDRERPILWDEPIFYFQQPTVEELKEAADRKLITLPCDFPGLKS